LSSNYFRLAVFNSKAVNWALLLIIWHTLIGYQAEAFRSQVTAFHQPPTAKKSLSLSNYAK